jgi:hypothetical protein
MILRYQCELYRTYGDASWLPPVPEAHHRVVAGAGYNGDVGLAVNDMTRLAWPK